MRVIQVTRVEAVAQAYGLTTTEVERWPGRTVEIFHRVAIHRGWITQPIDCERGIA